MGNKVVVVDADKKQCRHLCSILEKKSYQTFPLYSLSNLEKKIQGGDLKTVIIDIDTILIDNRSIRDMTLKNPGIHFLCLSKNRFHPELKEAICYHIYACINKPVDLDELLYWLRSIFENYEEQEHKNET